MDETFRDLSPVKIRALGERARRAPQPEIYRSAHAGLSEDVRNRRGEERRRTEDTRKKIKKKRRQRGEIAIIRTA